MSQTDKRPQPDTKPIAAQEPSHDHAGPATLDELYNDPETLKRLGVVLATAALRTSTKY